MPSTSRHEVTGLLRAWSNGDEAVLEKIASLVEAELRRLARRFMNRERPCHILQPTALINEAYVRLIERRDVSWQNRAHFFVVAAQLMRRILVDFARRRPHIRRQGDVQPVSLDEALELSL